MIIRDHIVLRPQKWGCLSGTGQGGGKGRTREWRLDRGYRPKKTGETVDHRQNNGNVKAVSSRHCAVTRALRNCGFNCCAIRTILSVALLLRSNPKSNFRSPAPPPCSWSRLEPIVVVIVIIGLWLRIRPNSPPPPPPPPCLYFCHPGVCFFTEMIAKILTFWKAAVN